MNPSTGRILLNLEKLRPLLLLHLNQCRAISSTPVVQEGGFIASLFDTSAKIEVQHTPHTQKLTSTEEIIEFQYHQVRPDSVDNYLKAHQRQVEFIVDNYKDQGLKLHCLPVANFNVIVGDPDQYVHIWRYEKGWETFDGDHLALRMNEDAKNLYKDVAKCLRGRVNQVMVPFSFWPAPTGRKANSDGKPNLYEMRSYNLKPGTMIEWGNYWAGAIKMRNYKNDTEPYLGMFSQLGELYNVKHIWCYESFQARKDAREQVWEKYGDSWTRVVSGTMPLVRHMTSRLMVPLEHSPTQ